MASPNQHWWKHRSATLAGVFAVMGLLIAHSSTPMAQDELDFLLEDAGKAEEAQPQEKAEAGGESKSVPAQPAPAQPAQASPAAGETSGNTPATAETSVPDQQVSEAETVATPVPIRKRPQLEEIVVVATKRAQAEIDVPIAISVVDSEFIAQQGITDLQGIGAYVPNAKIQTSAVFPDIRIRGFGSSPLNPVFEQSVGLVLDGIPYGNKAFYQGALFDIDHVEVLRGPQGALHGKNTTAGLINIITKGPSTDTTATVDLQSGDLNHRRIEAGLGAALIPDLMNFRVAVLDDRRDGYFENTTALTVPGAPASGGARDREAYRIKLEFPDLLGSELQLAVEKSDSVLTGGYELNRVPEHTRNFIRRFDPNVDFEPNNFIGSFDHKDGVVLDAESVLASWSDDWGGWSVNAVAGNAKLGETLENDTDFSPVPVSFTLAGRTTEQTTFELRTTSPSLPGLLGLENLFGRSLGNTDFTVGVFRQERQIADLFSTLNINDLLLVEFLLIEQSPQLGPILGPLLGILLPALPPDLETNDLLAAIAEEQTTLFFDEEAQTDAVFGQLNWYFLPEWTLELGLRSSKEQKKAHIRRVFDSQNTLILSQVLMWEEFDRQLERKESQLSPKISLNFKPNDNASFFVSWGNAYKAGGFNAFASGGSDDELVFEPEIVEQWAIDAKLRLFDDSMKLNLTFFRMDLEDFQILTANPSNLVITIENAAIARAQGAEADLTWLATDWLTLRAAVGYNDSEFLDFPIGTCPQDMENSDGDSEPRCDLSGKPLSRAPKWANTLTATVIAPIKAIPFIGGLLPSAFDNIGFVTSVTGEYQGAQFLNDDLDERKKQESFIRYRASVGFGDLNQAWSLRLSVENLTNEGTALTIGEIPAVAPGHFYQIPDAPRVAYAHFRYDF